MIEGVLGTSIVALDTKLVFFKWIPWLIKGKSAEKRKEVESLHKTPYPGTGMEKFQGAIIW